MKCYTITLTSIQTTLIQSNILDICNVRFQSKLEDYNFVVMDEYDVHRCYIHHAMKWNGKNWTLQNIDEKRLYFIISEINYWISDEFGRDKSEIMSGRKLCKKIQEAMDPQIQRDKKLKLLL